MQETFKVFDTKLLMYSSLRIAFVVISVTKKDAFAFISFPTQTTINDDASYININTFYRRHITKRESEHEDRASEKETLSQDITPVSLVNKKGEKYFGDANPNDTEIVSMHNNETVSSVSNNASNGNKTYDYSDGIYGKCMDHEEDQVSNELSTE